MTDPRMVSPGPPLRLGVLYPAAPSGSGALDQAEDDYRRLADALRPSAVAEVVHTRWDEMPAPDADDTEWIRVLTSLGSDERLLAGAERLAPFAPDVVTWACTSCSFLGGRARADHQAQLLSSVLGVPASSTSLGFLAAVEALSVSRVVIASIYEPAVSRAFEQLLSGADVNTIAVRWLAHDGLGDFVTWGRDELLQVVDACECVSADAVLIPETGLHTTAWLDDLECRAGKHVLTANQVSVWHAVRLAGRYKPQPGLGSLFLCGPETAR